MLNNSKGCEVVNEIIIEVIRIMKVKKSNNKLIIFTLSHMIKLFY